MPLKQKSNEKMHRRHLEEVPFYKLRHTFDELPLDPVKPFIIEKMREFSSFLPIKSYLSRMEKQFLIWKPKMSEESKLWINRITPNMTEKLKTSRSPAFTTDLSLHTYVVNESCSPTTPTTAINSKNMADLRQTTNIKSTSIKSATDIVESNWKWLQDEPGCKSKLQNVL